MVELGFEESPVLLPQAKVCKASSAVSAAAERRAFCAVQYKYRELAQNTQINLAREQRP